MLDILIFVCLTVRGHIINDAIIYPGCSKERLYREYFAIYEQYVSFRKSLFRIRSASGHIKLIDSYYVAKI